MKRGERQHLCWFGARPPGHTSRKAGSGTMAKQHKRARRSALPSLSSIEERPEVRLRNVTAMRSPWTDHASRRVIIARTWLEA
jgi:hypothetical protein